MFVGIGGWQRISYRIARTQQLNEDRKKNYVKILHINRRVMKIKDCGNGIPYLE